jgi:Asp-tRNA(Asn)/Glu-tRNA(Gln) amidotransferase C subunit
MVGKRLMIREEEVRKLEEELENILNYALERMRGLPLDEEEHKGCRELSDTLVNAIYKVLNELDKWVRRCG